jgi:ring-1,2-phenylacetyl-CoA epoxidase subunit PaaE
MSLFGKLFGKKKVESKRGFHQLTVKDIKRLTPKSVKVTFDIPEGLTQNFQFIPGQYINVAIDISDAENRRSYSICSAVNEDLSIAVKEVEGGLVSNYINDDLQVEDNIFVSEPMGNFQMTDAGKNYTAFAAGSGITPILSMVKGISLSEQGRINLFYCNRSAEETMFKSDLDDIANDQIKVNYLFTREENAEGLEGRLDEKKISELLRNDLDLLKSDGFFICGPEQMIVDTVNALKTFGVPENKIHYELFTTPEIMKQEKQVEVQASFNGISKVTVVLDEEETVFDLATDGDPILDEVEAKGIDAPYSCRGGVCCTCRAKVIEGTAKMDSNMALTDKEVEEGYILTCQAHPTSEKIKITYDE